MPAVAIKISEEVAELVRRAAKVSDRSMAGQIEHWAKLAMEVEDRATVSEVNAIKGTEMENPAMRQRVMTVLDGLRSGSHFASTRASLREPGLPLYEANPDDPESIVEVGCDGSRRRGRFVNRVFVAEG